jgi:transposase
MRRGSKSCGCCHFLDGEAVLATVRWTDRDLVPEVYVKEERCREPDRRTAGVQPRGIRLVRASGEDEYPVLKIAGELGVTAETLRSWIKQDEINAGEREGLATEGREELRRSRREVKVLCREKEMLRRAPAFFA